MSLWSTCSHFSIRNRILPFRTPNSAPSATGEIQSPKWTWTTWPEAAPPGGPQSLILQLGKVTGTSAGQRTLGSPPIHRPRAGPVLTARHQQRQGELLERNCHLLHPPGLGEVAAWCPRRSEGSSDLRTETWVPVTGWFSHTLCVKLCAGCSFNCLI